MPQQQNNLPVAFLIKKSCKILENFFKFLKIFKNKNHCCLVPPHEFGKLLVVWGTRQRRIR